MSGSSPAVVTVGIDYRSALRPNPTGVGRYVRDLVGRLPVACHNTRYELFHDGGPLPMAGGHASPTVFQLGVLRVAWEEAVLPARLASRRLTVYHGPAALLPMALPRSVGAVVTVHDVVQRRYPETFDRVHLAHLLLSVGYALKRADAIIADSSATAADVTTFYGISPSKIRVIHLGLNDCFRRLPADAARLAVRDRFCLTRPYVLYVGGFGKRKNVETLLLAFRELRRSIPSELDLVLVGGGEAQVRARAGELGLGDVTRFPGYVDERKFAALYGAAAAFAYPSLYEGFGYPVLEAMTCGAPVVCARTSSLPEVAGSAAILVDPQDVAAWTRALRLVVERAGKADEMRSAGFAQAARFSLDAQARATNEVYLDVADEQKRRRARAGR